MHIARFRDLEPIRRSGDRRVAVIDIGSNSIRLVVYDRLCRAPVPVFNEKVMCGLGRSLVGTGRLDPDGVAMALANLARFRALLETMEVRHVDVLATAAVREAEDGAAFVDRVRRQAGLEPTVISGAEEARLSALGVLSGLPGADGVMGDIGGGSLELVGIDHGRIGEQVTLPLGPFRLMDRKGGPGKARPTVRAILEQQGWLRAYRGRHVYPVGGAWRSIAKIHLARRDHPLHVIQQLTVPGKELEQLAGLIAGQGRSSLRGLAKVASRRLDTLPYAALVLQELLAELQPREVVFSAFGLREGHLFDLLPEDQQAEDPLLAGCLDVARRVDRFGHAERLHAWLEPLFASDSGEDRRLREAACLLSDICWLDHPDYRAGHALARALRLPLSGIDHAGRAFLGAALFVRYGEPLDRLTDPAVGWLLSDEQRTAASRLGLALRFVHRLTGGSTRALDESRLEMDEEEIRLRLSGTAASLDGDMVRRRLDDVAKALDRRARVVAAGAPAPPDGALPPVEAAASASAVRAPAGSP